MKLSKLQLENFRNYGEYSYQFSSSQNCTILVGENGLGKTNLLEAIYVLSLGRSFRSTSYDSLVEWEKPHLRCKADILINDETTELEVFYANQPRRHKNFKKNGVNLRHSSYIGNLLTVLFHPEDLNLLYLSPSLRRKYLNTVLSQTDKHYLEALSKYNKILKQRNALLKLIREGQQQEIDSWDEQLIEYGSIVTLKRIEFINFLNDKLQAIYQSISDSGETLQVKYQAKFSTTEDIPTAYKAELIHRQQRDTRQGQTTCGPHRDDLLSYINDHEISESASRGEFRTLLLSLKIAEIAYIKERTGHNPILLLDDVFSELDLKRQAHLLKIIQNCQTIITTTDLAGLEELAKRSTIIQID